MIAKAIEKIIEIAKPHIIDIGTMKFTDKQLERIPEAVRGEPIKVQTLSALITYVEKIMEQADCASKDAYFIHVVGPTEVRLLSKLDYDRKRECLMVAEPQLPRIPFEQFVDTEKMIIILQSTFMRDAETDLDTVKKFVGTATAGTIKDYSDDGVSQMATVTSGARGKENKLVPSPCILRPIRTFIEVEQPASDFIFRLRTGAEDKVLAGLFEADGGAWKIKAMSNIVKYLRDTLKDTEVEIIG